LAFGCIFGLLFVYFFVEGKLISKVRKEHNPDSTGELYTKWYKHTKRPYLSIFSLLIASVCLLIGYTKSWTSWFEYIYPGFDFWKDLGYLIFASVIIFLFVGFFWQKKMKATPAQ